MCGEVLDSRVMDNIPLGKRGEPDFPESLHVFHGISFSHISKSWFFHCFSARGPTAMQLNSYVCHGQIYGLIRHMMIVEDSTCSCVALPAHFIFEFSKAFAPKLNVPTCVIGRTCWMTGACTPPGCICCCRRICCWGCWIMY